MYCIRLLVCIFWLIPRLPDLRDELQQTDIQLLSMQAPRESADENADLIIYMGEKCNESSLNVLDEEVCAVCSPNFSQKLPFASPEELLDQPLLSLSGVALPSWYTWQSWFQALGVEGRPSGDLTSFSNYDLVVRAALEGQGIALGWLGLIEPLIEKGDLVLATPDIVKSNRSYNIICRQKEGALNGPQRVLKWISEQFAEQGKP